jgi:general secretion pathway protein I
VSGRSTRGITLLEMIVAMTILAVAIVGLMSGLSATTRNAARLQDYDRAVQLGRLRMNELIVDTRAPRNTELAGPFDAALTGGAEAGWKARITEFEKPPVSAPGQVAIDRIELELWWKSGLSTRTFTLEGYRQRTILPEDLLPEAAR